MRTRCKTCIIYYYYYYYYYYHHHHHYLHHCYSVVVIAVINHYTLLWYSEFTDHCLNEAFNASCPEGRVVLVTEARFGRMRPGRCIGGAFNVGCYKDIKSHLDSLCTARSRCDVSVRDLVDLHPCQRDFVSYLEVGYVCVEGRVAAGTHDETLLL